MFYVRFSAPVAAVDLCCAFLFAIATSLPLIAQDDITTQNATSGSMAYSSPGRPRTVELPERRGLAYHRQPGSYDFHDFAPATYLDAKLPNWIDLQAEERFRYEAYDNSSFKANVDDSYLFEPLPVPGGSA